LKESTQLEESFRSRKHLLYACYILAAIPDLLVHTTPQEPACIHFISLSGIKHIAIITLLTIKGPPNDSSYFRQSEYYVGGCLHVQQSYCVRMLLPRQVSSEVARDLPH